MIRTEQLNEIDLALETYERAEARLIELVRDDPIAAEPFMARLMDSGQRLPIVALGIRYAAQERRYPPQALAERSANL